MFPNAAINNSINAISGTSSAVPPGLQAGIEIKVLNIDTTRCWDGGSWSIVQNLWRGSTGSDFDASFSTWFSVNPGTWTYTGVNFAGYSGYRYNIQTRATDKAGNVETPGAGLTFIYDNEKPVSMVTSPSSLAKTNTVSIIQGTAQDYTANDWATGVSTTNGVTVALYSVATSSYYAGAGNWNAPSPIFYSTIYSSITYIWQLDPVGLGIFQAGRHPGRNI